MRAQNKLATLVLLVSFFGSISYAKIIDINYVFNNTKISNIKKAEILVSAGEQLLVPAGITYADSLFNTALLKDPGNIKANFYRRMLAPIMVFKGYHRRVKNLTYSKGSKRDIESYNSALEGMPSEGGFKDFLNGESWQKPFKNVSDIQKLMDDAVRKFDLLRLFLKKTSIKQATIPIVHFLNIHEGESNKSFNDVAKLCNVTQLNIGKFEIAPCKYISVEKKVVDNTDLQGLKGITAGMEILFAISSSYNLNGALDVASENSKREDQQKEKLTDKELFKILRNNKKFGKLRNRSHLAVVPDLAGDIYAAVKWYRKLDSKLCKRDHRVYYGSNKEYSWTDDVSVERPNNLLDGVCASPRDENEWLDVSKKVELALSGSFFISEVKRIDYSPKSTVGMVRKKTYKFNVLAPFFNPVNDISVLLPSKFDKCGDADNIGDDPTLLGIFPDGDAQDYSDFENNSYYDQPKSTSCK